MKNDHNLKKGQYIYIHKRIDFCRYAFSEVPHTSLQLSPKLGGIHNYNHNAFL